MAEIATARWKILGIPAAAVTAAGYRTNYLKKKGFRDDFRILAVKN